MLSADALLSQEKDDNKQVMKSNVLNCLALDSEYIMENNNDACNNEAVIKE